MEFGLFPSLASLSLIIVLALVYFNKKSNQLILNKLYKANIILIIITALSQILYVISYNNLNSYILKFIFSKLYFAFEELTIFSLILIMIVIVKKINVTNIKELFNYTKKIKLFMMISIILTILIMILPPYEITTLSYDSISYNSRLNSIYEIIFTIYYSTVLLITYIKNKSIAEKQYKVLVISMIILMFITCILQFLFFETSFFITYLVICCYLLYFIYTNPDIELLKEINIAQIDINTSTKAKTDFLSNITEEMRKPLDVISSTCNSLIHYDNFSEDEAKLEIKQIFNSGMSLIDIVNNIVNMSKAESGKNKIVENTYNVKEFINELHENALNKLNDKKIEFKLELDENISSELYGDSSKLGIVLSNVIINAINYTEVGKVTFSITGKKDLDFETLLFKVSDTGNGIKPEDQVKMFQKGTRLSNSIESEIEGSGLGLSLAKEQIEAIGGKIWFTSEYRVGTTFYIELKQKIMDKTPIKDVKDTNYNPNEIIDCSKYRLLIVDDSKQNLMVIKRLIDRYKFQTEYALSGKECVYKIKNDEKFDMIFLDHFMPEMDGIETIRVLKSLDGYKLPPIICVTANALSGMKDGYLKEGFDDFIAKPINTKDLDKVVKKYFMNK